VTDPDPPTRRAAAALLILSVSVVLGLSVWFAASAAAPQLQLRWGLDSGQAGLLTSLVQLGFVAGTLIAALLNLADIFPSRSYFAASTAGAALANAALLVVPDYGWALAARFATGFFMAGVYPPAMKMAATWYRRSRGLAIGTVVGALTLGKSTPYLVDAFGGAGIEWIVWSTSLCGLTAATLIAVAWHDGPFAFPKRTFSWSLAGDVVRDRRWRRATGGYLGHMWELYAFWTWITAWVAASVSARAHFPVHAAPDTAAKLVGFAAIAVGAIGCVWGGKTADRIGYAPLTIRALAASGSCALLAGAVFGQGLALVLPLVLVWGFFVIADSAQFSALVTEVVQPHAVGTALTLQVALGFLLTTVTIQLVPWAAELIGWRWSFLILVPGPLFGIASIRRLDRNPERTGVVVQPR